MSTEIKLHWRYAKSIKELDLAEDDFTKKKGVYFWVYRGTPERIYYVGLTNGNFKSRFLQHIRNQLTGEYRTFGPEITMDSALDFLSVSDFFVNSHDTMTDRILNPQNMKLLEMSSFYFATPEPLLPSLEIPPSVLGKTKPSSFWLELLEGHITRAIIEFYAKCSLNKEVQEKYKFINGQIRIGTYSRHFKFIEDHKLVIKHLGLPQSLEYISGNCKYTI